MHILALVAIAALPFSMTSCDDPWHDDWHDNWHDNGGYDDGGNGDNNDNTLYDMANTLIGEWYGPMNLYEEQNDGSYALYSFDADMVFYTNSSSSTLSGSGIETDYATNSETGETESQQLRFTWSINESTGDISITYTNSKSTFVLDYSATQRGFYLDNSNFYGYMLGSNNNDYIVFDFDRVTKKMKAASGTTTTTTAKNVFGSSATMDALVTNVPQKLPKR